MKIRGHEVSTKFIGTILAQVFAFTGLVGSWLAGSEYVTVTIATLAIYASADVTQKVKLNGQPGGE